MNNKICNTCFEEKEIKEYSLRNAKTHNYHNRCKSCTNIYAKLYRNENKEIIHIKNKKHYETKGRELKKIYDKQNSDKRREYERKKYKDDINYRMRKVLRTRFNKTVTNKKISKSIINYIGIDMDLFKKWIEFRFDDKMSWSNYGTYWDIDHVMPCHHYDLSLIENVFLCYNWRNLQPLEKKINYSKNKKINYDMCLIQINKVLQFESLYFETKLSK